MSALMEPSTILKLDLASGHRPRDGFEGVDVHDVPGVKHVVNLWQFPWPWEDSSVDELFCSHHVEHIPMVYVASDGKTYKNVPDAEGDLDLFLKFFDECFRVLKPRGRMTVIVPTARSNRGFQDPTHRRFLVAESFLYLTKSFKEANGLGHYLGGCDFELSVNAVTDISEELRVPEVQQQRANNLWNVVSDWRVSLTANKEGAPGLRDAFGVNGPVIVKTTGTEL